MRDRLPPLTPLDAAVEVQDGRVRIVWAMSPDADVIGYDVERRKGGGDSSWTRLTKARVPARALEYVDATVRGGSIYAWRVRAVDDAGNASPWCTPVTARADERTPPDAPRALVATLGTGRRATYRWQRPAAADVAGYHVYRGVAGGGRIRLTQLPVAALSFVDTAAAGAGLMPGITYGIDVVAVDSSTNESKPASIQLAVPDDDPPAPPRAVRAEGRYGGSVRVTWTASTALDVASYEVAVADTGRTPRTVGRTGTRGPFLAVDTAARDGVSLRYSVVAVDSAGNRSPAATDSIAKVDEERPSSPRATWAVRSGADVRLGWERVASHDLAGYVVYRATSLSARLEEIGRTAPGIQELVDRAAPASVYYAVRAVDRSGNLSIPQGLVTPVRGTP
jgi:fibronectin type 3 domain-containing protein